MDRRAISHQLLIILVAAAGAVVLAVAAERVTSMSGDERWPSWTPDGRIVFAHRERENGPGGADTGLAQWDLFVVSPGEAPQALTATAANEIQPRVSPDGTRILF